MSSQVDQQVIWTPPVIATIVYRVIMIFVSFAFIWKKYRRPARQIDEEQLVGVLLPSYNTHIRRTRSSNEHIPRRASSNAQTLREIISAHLEEIMQSALGLDDDGGSDIFETTLSFNDPSGASSTYITPILSVDDGVGLDFELGDLGLRHRSADPLQSTPHDKNSDGS